MPPTGTSSRGALRPLLMTHVDDMRYGASTPKGTTSTRRLNHNAAHSQTDMLAAGRGDPRCALATWVLCPGTSVPQRRGHCVCRPGAAWGAASGWGGLLLPPPPSQPEAVEHWTRALFLDTHDPEEVRCFGPLERLVICTCDALLQFPGGAVRPQLKYVVHHVFISICYF